MQRWNWKPLTIAIVALAAVWSFGACALGQEVSPPAAAANSPPGRKAPASSRAGGLLRVVAEPESGLVSHWLIVSLVESQTTLDGVLRALKAEETPPERRPEFSAMGLADADPSPGIYELSLAVKSYDESLPADKLLDGLLNMLRNQMQNMTERQVQESETRRSFIERELVATQMRVQKLAEQSGVRLGSDQNRLAAEIAMQALAASVEQQTLEARANAIAGRIAQLRTEAQTIPSDDTVQALTEAVHLLSQQLKRQQELEKQALPNERERVEVNLANARVELSRYRASLAEGAHGQRLNELRRRHDDTSIELEEVKHKHEVLLRTLALIQASTVTSIEIEAMQRQLADLLDERSRIEAKIRSFRTPDIKIIR